MTILLAFVTWLALTASALAFMHVASRVPWWEAAAQDIDSLPEVRK